MNKLNQSDISMNEYQELSGRTLMMVPDFELTRDDISLVMALMNLLITQSGLAELVKKGIFHRRGMNCVRFDRLLSLAVVQIGQLMAAWTSYNGAQSILGGDSGSVTPKQLCLLWNVLGLFGESGEVAALVADAVERNGAVDVANMTKELGDVEWYLSATATHSGAVLGVAAVENVNKLIARFPDGYSPERTTYRGEGAK